MREDEIILLFKRNKYISYIFGYGMIPIIFLLEYYIQLEDYEECIPIKEAVKDINDHTSQNLFLDTDKMDSTFDLYGYKGKRSMKCLIEDVTLIKDEIQSIKI